MRRSLDNRMDAVFDKLLRPGSVERAIYFLRPAHRAALDHHRRTTVAAISRFENSEPGSWFGAYLNGDPDAQVPPMPRALRDALKMPEPPTVTPDMSDADVARLWQRYALGDEQ